MEPGGLTAEGKDLIHAMAELGFVLDLSHMDEPAALECLDIYPGRSSPAMPLPQVW